MYTMILADGTEIKNLTLNGNTYVSPVKIDEDILKGNMSTVVFSDEEHAIEMHNVILVQQAEYQGEFYLSFRELTKAEIEEVKKSEYLNALEDIKLKIAEIEKSQKEQDEAIVDLADIMGGNE